MLIAIWNVLANIISRLLFICSSTRLLGASLEGIMTKLDLASLHPLRHSVTGMCIGELIENS